MGNMIEKTMDEIKSAVREIPDFPKPGINFKDITPILKDPDLFKKVINIFYNRYKNKNINAIAAIEARGFIFGAALAQKMGASFIPIRKKGKLPYKTVSATYDLEYGTDAVEMHSDALKPGDRVIILDDLAATGGTAAASAILAEKLGAYVEEVAFVIELTFLNPRQKLKSYNFFSITQFDS